MLDENKNSPAAIELSTLIESALTLSGYSDFVLAAFARGYWNARIWHDGRKDWLSGGGASASDALRALLENLPRFEAHGNRFRKPLRHYLTH